VNFDRSNRDQRLTNKDGPVSSQNHPRD